MEISAVKDEMQPRPPKTIKVNQTRNNITSRQQRFPGKGESLKTAVVVLPIKRMDNISSSSKSRKSLQMGEKKQVALDPRKSAERRDQFSKFKPLPAINSGKHQRTSSGKRSLPKQNSVLSVDELTAKEDDESLLDTIKKMRLGTEHSSYKSTLKTKPPHLPCGDERRCELSTMSVSTEISVTRPYTIQLVIRLPKGQRVEHTFKSSDTLMIIYQYLTKEMKTCINNKKHILYISQVPKMEIKGLSSSLNSLGIKDKTVLILDTRD